MGRLLSARGPVISILRNNQIHVESAGEHINSVESLAGLSQVLSLLQVGRAPGAMNLRQHIVDMLRIELTKYPATASLLRTSQTAHIWVALVRRWLGGCLRSSQSPGFARRTAIIWQGVIVARTFSSPLTSRSCRGVLWVFCLLAIRAAGFRRLRRHAVDGSGLLKLDLGTLL